MNRLLEISSSGAKKAEARALGLFGDMVDVASFTDKP